MQQGTKLGRYEIRSMIGLGGMGEVYRAFDPTINRDVAIKILPAAVSADKERLIRFQQEARAAGRLNHPNILTIHHIDTHDGIPYIVSELLEGETLRERMNRSALPLTKTVDYALQVTHGLAAAHGKGIVHRDLKPENLFITKDGRIKILDFGLAKLTTAASTNVGKPDDPTRKVLTEPGTIVGTVNYMSPEQVRAQPLDQRSDIFSFGAILYEMLTNNRAFHGASAVDTMSAILNVEPPGLSATTQAISPFLQRIVNRCLAKIPEERFQSAHDLAFSLEAPTGVAGSESVALPVERTMRTSRERIAWIALTALLILGAFVISYFRRGSEAPGAVRFLIAAPAKTSIIGNTIISPDGRRMVFLATDSSGKNMLWLRALDSLEAQPLAGTDDATPFSFWSPDSRFVGFFAGGKLKKIEVTGGAPQTVCDAPDGRGGTWNSDGVIVFAPHSGSELYRVNALGGVPAPVTRLDPSRQESSHRLPSFLPDGRHFLYTCSPAGEDGRGIYIGSIDSEESKQILKIPSKGEYVSPGYLLFVSDGKLMAQHFDIKSWQLSGDPLTIAEQVVYNPANGTASFSVSTTGTLLYRSNDSSQTQLTWFDRRGKETGKVGPPDLFNPWLSPDGKRVIAELSDEQTGLHNAWLVDLARNLTSRFTFEEKGAHYPLWSPDGTRVAFSSGRHGVWNVYLKSTSGLTEAEPIHKSDTAERASDWSADGRYILIEAESPKTMRDLWVIPLEGSREPIHFLETAFDEMQARFSPDGHWIAYTSNETGKFEVYVQPFPGSGAKWQISTKGGGEPFWRRDGKELFYVTPDKKIMAVDIDLSPALSVGAPKPLFDVKIQGPIGTDNRSHFVASADGQHFLVQITTEGSDFSPVTVVMNWMAGLNS